MRRIAFIGLDGLSWHVVYHYYREYSIWRNLVSMARNGLAYLNWCIPPYTPPSWTTILTGVHPWKHRILGFAKPYLSQDNTIKTRPVLSTDLDYPMLNEILSFKGMRGIVYNCYPSYPLYGIYHVNQVVISDIFSPRFYIHPKSYSMYEKYFTKPLPKATLGTKKWHTQLRERVVNIIDGLIGIDECYEPDYIVAIIHEPDYIMHNLQYIANGIYDSRVAEVFDIIDEYLKWIRDRYEYVFIASDHGFNIHVNRLNIYHVLWQIGLIKGEDSLKNKIVSKILSLSIMKYLAKSILTGLKRQNIYYLVRKFISRGEHRNKTLSNGIGNINSLYTLDIYDSDDAWTLYVIDYKPLVNYIEQKMREYASFLRIVCKVHLGDSRLVAFIIEPRGSFYFMNDRRLRYSLKMYFATARHGNPGLFIGYGVKAERKCLTSISNTDILATVLSTLNMPIPSYTDGTSLIENRLGTFNYRSRIKMAKKALRIKDRLSGEQLLK